MFARTLLLKDRTLDRRVPQELQDQLAGKARILTVAFQNGANGVRRCRTVSLEDIYR